MNRLIGLILSIVQLTSAGISTILIIIAIISKILIIMKINKAKESGNNELRDLLQQKNKKINKKCILLIVIVIIILGASGLLRIIRSVSLCKPIIYLYPKDEIAVSVVLGKPESLTCTYPKYKNSWKVIANPNGDLIDLDAGRKLYALYWEANTVKQVKSFSEGFCIKGEDSAKFLEEKLEILGLTEREAEEFIVYWLPELESNKYNLIRFQTKEEIAENMPLEINPKPDSVIRVMMEYKPICKYVNLQEQKLTTPKREGFVVVEWGGSRLK